LLSVILYIGCNQSQNKAENNPSTNSKKHESKIKDKTPNEQLENLKNYLTLDSLNDFKILGFMYDIPADSVKLVIQQYEAIEQYKLQNSFLNNENSPKLSTIDSVISIHNIQSKTIAQIIFNYYFVMHKENENAE